MPFQSLQVLLLDATALRALGCAAYRCVLSRLCASKPSCSARRSPMNFHRVMSAATLLGSMLQDCSNGP